MTDRVNTAGMKTLIYVVLLLFALFYLFPLYTAINTSLKTDEELATGPASLVKNPTIKPYIKAFNRIKRPLLNSIIMTSLATLVSTFLGAMSGFGFSKLRFKGDDLVFFLIIIGFYIAPQSILVPLLRFMGMANLYDTYAGLILTHTAYGIPITTLLFRNYFEGIPNSIFESAKVDGCGELQSFFKLALPLSLPGFAVAGIFQFTNIFNEFLFGLVLTQSRTVRPVTVEIANLKGTTVAAWNVQMAGVLMSIFPVMLIYIFLLRFVIKGLLMGSVKG